MRPRAFVDESYRSGLAGGTYLFAAITLSPDQEVRARHRMRRACPSRGGRLHWRTDRAEIRRRGLAAMAALPLDGVTLYRADVADARQERARQHGLWNLVFDQASRGVADLVLESRERRLNDRDDLTLTQLDSILDGGLRFVFARAQDEPLLWAADYLLGAVGAHLAGNDRHVDGLPDRLRRVELLPPLP